MARKASPSSLPGLMCKGLLLMLYPKRFAVAYANQLIGDGWFTTLPTGGQKL
jgi:hypothetical protein